MLSLEEILENAGLSFSYESYGSTKTKVFEYDDVIHHILLALFTIRKGYAIVFPSGVFVWTGENDSNRLLRMDVYFFFVKRRRKSPFKYINLARTKSEASVYILIIKQLTYNSKPLKRILLLREGLGD